MDHTMKMTTITYSNFTWDPMGSPTSEDDDDIRHQNKEPDCNEDDAIKAMQMIGRRLSNSSQGLTSSVHNDSKHAGFQSIFGKKCSITSSGIGSERDSPIVSPDSLLDSYHIENEHTMFFLQNDKDSVNDDKAVTEDKVKTFDTKLKEKFDYISEEVDIEAKASSGESTPCIEDDIIITMGDTKHHIAKSKLTSLISKLEPDWEYSKVKEMGDSGIDISSRKSSLDSTEEKRKRVRWILRRRGRKTSSLKTMLTPRGTMRKKKKSVRFADVLGLDLQNVKMFRDEVPRIPKCALRDLKVDLSEFDFGSPKSPAKTSYTPATRSVSHQTMVPMFMQPGATPHFNEIVRNLKVCLENAYMTEGDAISGTIKVYNLDFNKTVIVRWTSDEWKSSRDEKCTYVQGSSDSITDKFSFRLTVGQLPVGSRFQFCIQFTCAGHDYWDNNWGGNYVFQVFKSSGSAPSALPIAIQSQPSRNL